MSRTIKLKIAGRGINTDAPTVEDLLDQVRDYFDILRGVEEAMAEDGASAVEWRIVDARKSSPLALEAAAFPRQFAMNADRRVELVIKHTVLGLMALQVGKGRPPFFSEKLLAKAEKIFERVTNGLSETTIDPGPGLPPVTLDRASAHAAINNVRSILRPPDKPYKEIGSIEGYVHGLGLDRWGNRVLKVRHRLTGDEINCRIFGEALEAFADVKVGTIWSGCRVQLFGVIYYKGIGRIARVDVQQVRFLRTRGELPDVDNILDPNFTGGMSTEDYLDRVWNGDLS